MTVAVGVLAALAALVAAVWWLFWRTRPICKLTLREGDGVGLEFLVTDREATIGSGEDQTIVVSHPKVSRLHATLHLEESRFVLRDRSKHGVRVNGEPTRETELRSGDLISLAESVDLIFTRLG
jgi:pSer/pThr/pTyr-binding forkhead associated (FHA) protein